MPYVNPLEDKAAKRRAYLRGKQRYIDRAAAHKQKTKNAARELVLEFLRTNPCVDCGEPDPIVLEFDHEDPATKSFTISAAISSGNISLARIRREMVKCSVRCANCHRRRTALQFDWFRAK